MDIYIYIYLDTIYIYTRFFFKCWPQEFERWNHQTMATSKEETWSDSVVIFSDVAVVSATGQLQFSWHGTHLVLKKKLKGF